MTVKPVIHVGVDGSWRETGALEWALRESLLRHEPLRVVHVVEDREPLDGVSTDLVSEVQKYLDEAPGSMDHEAELVVGPPARILTEAAVGSRMLVVGRRGIGGFKRLLIGSTSEAVVSAATVPVVVVPDCWKPGRSTGRVLIALDDSDENEQLIEFGIAEARARDLPVRLVHVWDLPTMYSWDAMNIAGVATEWMESAERHLENVAAEWRAKYPDLTVGVDVRRGHVVDGVVSAAAETDAQLLVVGTRHHTRLASVLLGSVTRGVLQHATCPLAVVPPAVAI